MDTCCKDEGQAKESGCCEACPDKGCDGCACAKPHEAPEAPEKTNGCEGCDCGNR